MQLPGRYSFKNSCKKIMCAAIFLLGFFAFSNLVVSSQRGPAVVQTTWVSYANSRAIHGFQYPVKSTTNCKQLAAGFLSVGVLNISKFHSKLAYVSLKLHPVSILSKSHLSNFRRGKTIPQSGKNDAHPILS